MKFLEKWLEAVNKKNSVLCAGLDPAEFEMERGEKGLPEGIDKKEWSLRYIEAVAPYCAAIKPNIQYWKGGGDLKDLQEICEFARSKGLVIIDDSKLADIGSTNEAGVFYASQRVGAVTLALFAGNMNEAPEQLEKWRVGGIHMCLMSNPEYEREKNKPVKVDPDDGYDKDDIIEIPCLGGPHVRQYIQLAHDAKKFGLDGIVIGAPSKSDPEKGIKGNHIQESEIAKARQYVGDNMLVLLPGVGAQGGEAGAIWKYFDKDKVIVNVGRSLMLPNGSNSTPEQQAETAKQYQEMLNGLRE